MHYANILCKKKLELVSAVSVLFGEHQGYIYRIEHYHQTFLTDTFLANLVQYASKQIDFAQQTKSVRIGFMFSRQVRSCSGSFTETGFYQISGRYARLKTVTQFVCCNIEIQRQNPPLFYWTAWFFQHNVDVADAVFDGLVEMVVLICQYIGHFGRQTEVFATPVDGLVREVVQVQVVVLLGLSGIANIRCAQISN